MKWTRMIMLFLLVGMNISCDQITKHEVRERIPENEVIEVIQSNLILTNVENTGAAMSLGSELSPLLKVLLLQLFPILMMIGLIGFLFRNIQFPKIQQFAMACIIGGGIGNLIDRIQFNSVTDFMLIELGPFRTGIFNFADVSITIGVLIILISTMMNSALQHGLIRNKKPI